MRLVWFTETHGNQAQERAHTFITMIFPIPNPAWIRYGGIFLKYQPQ